LDLEARRRAWVGEWRAAAVGVSCGLEEAVEGVTYCLLEEAA